MSPAYPLPQDRNNYFVLDESILPAIARLEYMRERHLLFPDIDGMADRVRLFEEFWPFKNDYV